MVLHVIPNGRNTAYWIGKRDHKNQYLRANSHTDSSELGGKGVLLRAATSISACGQGGCPRARLWDRGVTPCQSRLPAPRAQPRGTAAPAVFIGLRVTDGPAITGGCRSHPSARWAPSVTLGESCLRVTAFNVTRGVSSVCRIRVINPDLPPTGLAGFGCTDAWQSGWQYYLQENVFINNANRQMKKPKPSPSFLLAGGNKISCFSSGRGSVNV